MIALILILLMTQASHASPRTVGYTLAMPDPAGHTFHVSVTFDGLDPAEGHVDLVMPAWRPGRYVILDLAAGVIDFAAADGRGKPLAWAKTDKSTWRIETGGAEKVTATYRVFADEFEIRTRGLDEEHGFVDGSAVFMYSGKYRSLPVRLEVKPYRGWHVTTGMDGKGTRFTAPDYDTFVDCPLEIGKQTDHEFTVKGVPHVLSVFGGAGCDADSLVKYLSRIVSVTSDFWGDMPYKRYVFLLHAAPWAGGGTEHINSTIMGLRPEDLRGEGGYDRFAGLAAHEFFHTWNVKRLRPKGIVPYDYTKENYVRELWIAEGTTSYYDGLLLVRAGLGTPERFLSSLASSVREDRMRPGNRARSLSESSFDAWINSGRSGPNGYNSGPDFYGKGAAVSLLLDLAVMEKTGGAKSLGDVMRLMYRRFPAGGTGYTVDDFQSAASEIAGADLSQFFRDYVHGTRPLPWEELLAAAGLRLAARDSVAKPWIGLTPRSSGDRLFISGVADGSPAREAGLDTDDEIVALDGTKASAGEFQRRIASARPGETLAFTLFRHDRLKEVRVTVKASPVPEYTIEKVPNPTPSQRRVYEAWLSAKWE